MHLRQKPSGIWVVDYDDETGDRRRVSTGLRDKAAATKRAREIVLGIDVKPLAGATPSSTARKGTTLRDIFDLCQKGNGPWSRHNAKSQATIRSNLRVLEPLMGDLLVTEVSYRKLEEAQAALLGMGYKPATVKRKMDMVGRALTYAMAHDIIAARPQMPGMVVVSQRTRVLSADEEALLFRLIAARAVKEPQRPWVRFGHLLAYLLDTACRLGEALALEEGWLETHRGRACVHVPAHVTKTGKARLIPLSQRVVESIAFLRLTAAGGRLLPMTAATAWYMLGNLKDEALAQGVDLSDVVLHTMRHTCLTRLLQRGMPLVKVSKWAGHANIKITATVYAHLEIDDLLDGVDLLDAGEPARHLKTVA